jgi:hypothetical protein
MVHQIGGQVHVNCIFETSNLGSIDMDSVLDTPIQDFLVVPALVAGVEVGVRGFESLNPVPCYHRHIGSAHDALPDHFNAMICNIYNKQEAPQ